MGFFLSSLLSSVVKVALTPVAVVKDAASVAIGEEASATKENLESAIRDVEDALDEATGG